MVHLRYFFFSIYSSYFLQGLLTFGIFVASILSYGFVTYVNHGWQYIQAFAAIPPIVTILLQAGFPESPKWLLSKDSSNSSRDQVAQTLSTLRPPGHDVQEEIQQIVNEVKNDVQNDATWEEVFNCRKAMIIGCGIMFFQAATGINSVVFYSTTIFELAGFDQSIIGTVCWTALNVFMTFVSAKLIDQAGRRTLVLFGSSGM